MIYLFFKLLRYLILFASRLLLLMLNWILISCSEWSSFSSTRGLYMVTDTRAA
jgi:hypothetical protein